MNDQTIDLAQTRAITRRYFLAQARGGVGAAALGALLGDRCAAEEATTPKVINPLAPKAPPYAPRAKSVIYLHMAGSPPQQELFDYKPKLVEMHDKLCPESFLENERFAFIQGRPKMLGTPYKFARHGESGNMISELLPHFAGAADDVTIINSMYTTEFNHAPAQLFLYTGNPRFGHASMGSWLTYGLGSESENLPGFVVLMSGGTDPSGGKSLWGSGFLPTVYQGVQCRSVGDPILYASNPRGMSRDVRRRSLDTLRRLNQLELEQFGDPETVTRIAQYELAYRMQLAVPDVMNIAKEPASIVAKYGAQPGKAAFANNCLLARRLVERGVRYVQLFDWGWDFHGVSKDTDIVKHLPTKCKQIDRPIAALLEDLKARGLLDETLVVWSGEFGRTSMRENRGGSYGSFIGRDHHPHCMSIWMAGGGVKGGMTYGATDELGYFVVEDKVSVHDLQATILHLTGQNAHELSYLHQGLEERLIGPTGEAKVLRALLA